MSSSRDVVIMHGAHGYPGENWFPWLKQQLEAAGYRARVPEFPTPEGQSLDNWLAILDETAGPVREDTILVGHSTGSLLILRELERLLTPVAGSFLVSTFARPLGIPEFDTLNASFLEGGFQWDAIRRHAGKSFVYHGDNDPYVPVELGREVAEQLGAKLNVVPGAGHFNATAGYTQFDTLLSDILSLAHP